jgi:excinuclease ABC subunit C
MAQGAAVVADYLTRLPNAPGVYRMMAANGDVLYVGKAANLKKRVVAYTKPYDQPARIARMIANTASMEFVQTRSEVEALLLEANLIKRLKPRYNVHLRDDKSFPFILVTGDHAQGRVFRAVRVRLLGDADAQHAAAGVLASELHGFGLREPDAAVFAASDQAVCGAVRGKDPYRGLSTPC